MSYDMNSPEILAMAAAYNAPAPMPPRVSIVSPYVLDPMRVAIGGQGGGGIIITAETRPCEWDVVYQNMTTDVPFFIVVSVGPLMVQGEINLLNATLKIGSESTNLSTVAEYWGTCDWLYGSFSINSGLLSAWVIPGGYYSVNEAYAGTIRKTTRYWLADVSGDLPPLK
jgi:hypothetical protein